MKLKQFKFKQILKLHLLKSSLYKNSFQKNNNFLLSDVSLTQTIADFKKVLQVVFKFDRAGKKILFIGTPKKLEQKINRLTNHVAVPRDFDLQGVISNINFSKIKINNKNYFSKSFANALLPKLTSKPDLVVLISNEKSSTILSQTSVAKVPLITFENNYDPKELWFSNAYNVKGFGDSLELANNENILFIGLDFLFRKKISRNVKLNPSQNMISHNSKSRG